MLKFYIKTTEALHRLRTDNDGVVSFEYVMVAACIVFAVALAFGDSTGGKIKDALTTALAAIVAKLPS
jgi:pilus assembly protein Flp/PilA